MFLIKGIKYLVKIKFKKLKGKWPAFRENFSNIKVHLIGPLQSNKVKQAVAMFDAIHTVDRLKLAQKLSNEVQIQGKAPEMFIQINTGEEKQKSGIIPSEADQFISDCFSLDLPIKGLMVIPPINEEPTLHFGLLRKIAHRNGLTGLSMGMSSDFESAIAMGATHSTCRLSYIWRARLFLSLLFYNYATINSSSFQESTKDQKYQKLYNLLLDNVVCAMHV